MKWTHSHSSKRTNTRLAAALAFPCSLFLKSQFPEEPPLEASEATVISLSCNKEKPMNFTPTWTCKSFFLFYFILFYSLCEIHTFYLSKTSIYKCIDKSSCQVLSGRVNTCTSTSPAIKQMCLAKSKQISMSLTLRDDHKLQLNNWSTYKIESFMSST